MLPFDYVLLSSIMTIGILLLHLCIIRTINTGTKYWYMLCTRYTTAVVRYVYIYTRYYTALHSSNT